MKKRKTSSKRKKEKKKKRKSKLSNPNPKKMEKNKSYKSSSVSCRNVMSTHTYSWLAAMKRGLTAKALRGQLAAQNHLHIHPGQPTLDSQSPKAAASKNKVCEGSGDVASWDCIPCFLTSPARAADETHFTLISRRSNYWWHYCGTTWTDTTLWRWLQHTWFRQTKLCPMHNLYTHSVCLHLPQIVCFKGLLFIFG